MQIGFSWLLTAVAQCCALLNLTELAVSFVKVHNEERKNGHACPEQTQLMRRTAPKVSCNGGKQGLRNRRG